MASFEQIKKELELLGYIYQSEGYIPVDERLCRHIFKKGENDYIYSTYPLVDSWYHTCNRSADNKLENILKDMVDKMLRGLSWKVKKLYNDLPPDAFFEMYQTINVLVENIHPSLVNILEKKGFKYENDYYILNDIQVIISEDQVTLKLIQNNEIVGSLIIPANEHNKIMKGIDFLALTYKYIK